MACTGWLHHLGRPALVLLMVGSACRPSERSAGQMAELRGPEAVASGEADTPPVISARHPEGMVVSGNPAATRAGAEVLGAGGNAVDAAVATAFALGVAEPTQSGLGGRTQGLVRMSDGTVYGVDATTEVPAGFDPARAVGGDYGWGAVGIPGTVAGLAALHGRFGRLPWQRILEPAIHLAREGVELTEGEARRLASAAGELAQDSGGLRHFLRSDGSPHPAGAVLRQPTLAATLEALASDGPDAFYRGDIARALTDEMARKGGWVTGEDLDAYQALPSLVVRGRYADLDIIGTYLPASGHTTIEALQILDHRGRVADDATGRSGGERSDVATSAGPFAAARVEAIAGALMLSFRDREAAQGPAAADAVRLTSSEWAAARAQELATYRLPTASEALEPAQTTHLSVVDAEGNAVSMTQSLGPTGGARVASEDLGFLYASTLGYLDDIQPGDRPWSSQSPLILTRNGELAYVIGGAGARRIISALVSVVVRLGDGVQLESALVAPRLHVDGDGVTLEAPVGAVEPETALADVIGALEERGIAWSVREFDVYFARLNAIAVDPITGDRLGVADPRWPWSGTSGPVR